MYVPCGMYNAKMAAQNTEPRKVIARMNSPPSTSNIDFGTKNKFTLTGAIDNGQHGGSDYSNP